MIKTALAFALAASLLALSCGRDSKNAPQDFVLRLQPNGASAPLPLTPGMPRMGYDHVGDVFDPLGKAPAVVRLNGEISVSGFAIDEPAGRAAAGVDIAIDSLPFAAHYALDRPDVAGYFKNPAYQKSGFDFSIPARYFEKGTHKLVARVIAANRQGYQEAPPITIEIQ